MMLRRVGYLHGGTGGKNVRELIDPWDYRQLRPKEEYCSYRQALFKPSKILEFDEHGTIPIYSSKLSIWRSIRLTSSRIIPTYLSWHLLFKNPYPCNHYLVSLEPLSMPFFMFCGLIGLWKCFKAFADNSLTLYELRLKKDGVHVEIFLLDWLGRSSKSARFTLDIKDLKPPPLYGDSRPLRGELFPHLAEAFEIPSERPKIPWVKYYDILRRKFFIPKDYIYMNRELMVAIMNGSYIQMIEDAELEKFK
jgi:hypothetical protein